MTGRRPSCLNPSCPQWLRDTNLSSRICNVLTAGGIETEEQLRGMLSHRTGQEILRALPNMGRKSMCELREWASATPPPSPTEPTIGDLGQSTFPPDHAHSIRTAIGYLADTCAKSGKLRNGETALYWHLVAVVGGHF